MIRLRGHYDGKNVILDQPVPGGLMPDTPVEVVIPDPREQALRELESFLKDLWSRPVGPPEPKGPRWSREDLYERGG
jgi:hypothetical protein